MAKLNFLNARDPEQFRRMQKLKENGLCYFCREGSAEDRTLPNVIKEFNGFYVTKNDFPIPGSICHVMIVPKRHITHTKYLLPDERVESFDAFNWAQDNFELPGFSVYVRVGSMEHTGATLDHTHFQLIVGVKRPEDCKEPDDIIYVPLGYKQK